MPPAGKPPSADATTAARGGLTRSTAAPSASGSCSRLYGAIRPRLPQSFLIPIREQAPMEGLSPSTYLPLDPRVLHLRASGTGLLTLAKLSTH